MPALWVCAFWLGLMDGVVAQPAEASAEDAQDGPSLIGPSATAPSSGPLPSPSRAVVPGLAASVDSLTPAPSLPPPPKEPEIRLPAEYHPWTRHPVGAFRTLKLVAETFDQAGVPVSRTQTQQRDAITAIHDEGYTLSTTVSLQIAEANVPSETGECSLHRLTDSAGSITTASELDPAEVNIDGETILCRRWRLGVQAGQRTGVETLWYSAERSPHLLRREKTMTETAGAGVTTTIQWVTQTGLPYAYRDQILDSYRVREEVVSPAGRIDRLEVRADGIPGGLVAASVTERDPEGRRVRWTVTELTDFASGPEDATERKHWRLLGRRAEARRSSRAD